MQEKARNFKFTLKKTSSKRNTIIVVTGIILVMLILAAIFFWPKDRDRVIKTAGGEIVIKEKPPLPTNPEMTGVRLTPGAPSSQDFLHAQPVLKHPDMQFVKYSYQWYVNGDSVPDAKGNILENKYFKKGDAAYCRIKAVRGSIEAEPIDSDEINIGNSPPFLNLKPVPPFDIPGEFSYTINAEDPDGDPLSYRLLEPLDRGIVLNGNTGVIKWYIDEAPADAQGQDEPAPRPEDEGASSSAKSRPEPETESAIPAIPSSITIIFEVSDSDGASVTGSIELNLSRARGSEVPK
ncbi:MAG: hypothetical protein NT166_23560 [Candidatus Aminicenantes bacterium]|nr:hypothetical protein [Candidatus Aminicenantes bacterium]